MRALVIAATLLGLSVSAAAEKKGPVTEYTLAGMIGGFDIGKVGGFAGGGHLQVARHYQKWHFLAEYVFLGVGEPQAYATELMPDPPEAQRGYLHRFGGGVRRYSGNITKSSFGTWGWVEVGAGVQIIQGFEEPIVRRDLNFGVGYEYGGRDLSRKIRTVAGFYAARLFVARTLDPTSKQPYDFGVMLSWGVSIGK
jgi:hypothetical protein